MSITPFKQDFGPLGYNAENKSAFLKAGKKYLNEIFKVLKQENPDVAFSAHINKGGIAVSGEIYGDIRLDSQRGVHVCLTERLFNQAETPFTLYAQTVRAYPGELNPKNVGQIVEGNFNVDPHEPERILTMLRGAIRKASEMQANNEAA